MKVTIYNDADLSYFNRIISNEGLTREGLSFDKINFDQANGITTSLTLNVNARYSKFSPTYVKVEDDAEVGLFSTQYWFVISSLRERSGQFTLILRRDFFRDPYFRHNIFNADTPFLVQKASEIPESLSYAQYLKTQNLSQIKKQEIQITDREGAKGWFVIYVAKTGEGLSNLNDKVLTYGSYKIDFTQHTHNLTTESPYEILAIPILGNYSVTDLDSSTYTSNLSPVGAKQIAQQFSLTLGSLVYDIQWLPFVTYHATDKGEIPANSQNYVIYNGSRKVGVCRVLETDTAYRTIPVTSIDALAGILDDLKELTPIQAREYEEEHYFRLVSPNYASQFEFSPIRNNHSFGTNFNVDIGLKPINPYIYVYPDFDANGLYGGRYRDGRGLILSGDFSLDQVSSAWTEYQLQNKNYQLIFDRNIQSLDLKNSYANQVGSQRVTQSFLKGTTATLGGVVGGALTGAKFGGPVGAVAGAVTGGVLSAGNAIYNNITTIQNVNSERAIRDDDRQAMIDQFQYQIGNIQAMPNTLTKVSATNPDYKVYPIIEVYECTSQEKKNLENSIKYNGIEINLISNLTVFTKGYIQGALLYCPRLDGMSYEQFSYLNSELEKGIYLKEV